MNNLSHTNRVRKDYWLKQYKLVGLFGWMDGWNIMTKEWNESLLCIEIFNFMLYIILIITI